MRDPAQQTRTAHRFRRRLTAAFVLVAAASAGLLAVTTFTAAREYRQRNFQKDSLDETRVALALAPSNFDEASFERLLAAYETRSEAAIVATDGSTTLTSSIDLDLFDVPADLRDEASTEPTAVEADVHGRSTLVVGATGRSDVRYYFFFSLEQLRDSLDELARVSAAGWVVTVLLAGAVGRAVARKTLRPVGAAASAAEAIAAGDLDTRLPVAGGDEFGALSASFNHMADELQATIDKLERAATRERQFTADVAHELRTPLTGMSASAALLADQLDELPSSMHRSAAVLIGDVDRLRALVLELLELSRLDAGTDPVDAEPLRIADAMEAVVAAARSRRHARVEVDADPDAVVRAEPVRLGRILGNLLDNAVSHGAGVVRVRARREGDDVLIDVVDDGPGIDEADLPHVFERFFKSDRSRASGGSGLGLAIAREQARAHGGELSAGNEPGAGARFTLRLRAGSLEREAEQSTA